MKYDDVDRLWTKKIEAHLSIKINSDECYLAATSHTIDGRARMRKPGKALRIDYAEPYPPKQSAPRLFAPMV